MCNCKNKTNLDFNIQKAKELSSLISKSTCVYRKPDDTYSFCALEYAIYLKFNILIEIIYAE